MPEARTELPLNKGRQRACAWRPCGVGGQRTSAEPEPPSGRTGFYGDLFPQVLSSRGELYLEAGLHRALRAALEHRSVLHVRVLNLD